MGFFFIQFINKLNVAISGHLKAVKRLMVNKFSYFCKIIFNKSSLNYCMFYNSSSVSKHLFSIIIRGEIYQFTVPRVMGILNLTPDSFYDGGKFNSIDAALSKVEQMLGEGADMIDVGAASSRPGAVMPSAEEELYRLSGVLLEIRKSFPQAIISVDTVHAEVARKVVEAYGVDIINDISAGEWDAEMFQTIAELKVPYVMMHMPGKPENMQNAIVYENFILDMFAYFSEKVARLRLLGVNDIILDPGFGFGKTVEHNFELLDRISDFKIFELPLMAGMSRKSMVYKTLGISPEESLNGTTVVNTFALLGGADILRVHDVKEAKECIKLYRQLVHK